MRKLLYIAILVFGLSVSSYAQVRLARVSSAQSAFRQTRVDMMLDKPQILTGKFSYTAPEMVEWKYDGGAQAQLPPQMLSFIAQAVSGQLAEDNDTFTVTWNGKTMLLTPKKKSIKKMFSCIKITFTPEGVAKTVVLEESSGDTTTIEFLSMHYKEIK